jgi:hypothetical protein
MIFLFPTTLIPSFFHFAVLKGQGFWQMSRAIRESVGAVVVEIHALFVGVAALIPILPIAYEMSPLVCGVRVVVMVIHVIPVVVTVRGEILFFVILTSLFVMMIAVYVKEKGYCLLGIFSKKWYL